MFKRIGVMIVSAVFMVNLCGCALLLAGAVGGAGTAVWLGGKLSKQVEVPKDKAVVASKKAMKALDLTITKETTKEDVVQLIGEYSDGRQVWIDVRALSSASSKIEVRVGATGDKGAAEEIMNKISRYL
jgi:hypothetical protein